MADRKGEGVQVLDTRMLAEACGEDRAFQRELLMRYRASLGKDLRLLAEAIAVEERDEARRLAHRVNGAARTMGAHLLFLSAERIERLAPEAGQAEWNARLLELQAERGRVEERLDERVNSMDLERARNAS